MKKKKDRIIYYDSHGNPIESVETELPWPLALIFIALVFGNIVVERVQSRLSDLQAKVNSLMDAVIAFLLSALIYAVLLFLCLPLSRNRYFAIFQSYAVLMLLTRLYGDIPNYWWIGLIIPCLHLIAAIREKNYWYTWVYCGTFLAGNLPLIFPSLKPYFLFV